MIGWEMENNNNKKQEAKTNKSFNFLLAVRIHLLLNCFCAIEETIELRCKRLELG